MDAQETKGQSLLNISPPNHPPITEIEAEGYLACDLMTALNAMLRYCPVLATENRKPACRYVQPGAGRLQASTLRREVECALLIAV